AFSWSGLLESISSEVKSQEKDILLSNLTARESPYLISLSSYNKLLSSINQSPIKLENDEVALYSDEEWSQSHGLLRSVLQSDPVLRIEEPQYKLASKLYTSRVVADRAITLSYALIVPDDMYNALAYSSQDSSLVNMVLESNSVKEKGLMQPTYDVD